MGLNFERLKIEREEPDLKSFHKEIQELKEAEEEEKRRKEAEGTTGSIHLYGLNPEELTVEDATVYQKFKKLELTREECQKWRQNVVADAEKRAPKGPSGSAERRKFFDKDSRHIFMQYIFNKIGSWENWEEKKREMKDFREEITALKENSSNPHLAAINPESLNYRDLEIYKKFKEGSLKDSSDEFRAYRKEIFRDCQEYFRQMISRDKQLKEQVEEEIKEKEAKRPDASATKESEKIFQTLTYLSFQEVFSRNNFLAWLQNEMLKKEYEKRKKSSMTSIQN